MGRVLSWREAKAGKRQFRFEPSHRLMKFRIVSEPNMNGLAGNSGLENFDHTVHPYEGAAVASVIIISKLYLIENDNHG